MHYPLQIRGSFIAAAISSKVTNPKELSIFGLHKDIYDDVGGSCGDIYDDVGGSCGELCVGGSCGELCVVGCVKSGHESKIKHSICELGVKHILR